ncbi:MAG: hypothetical protein K1X88_15855 [Nannocystaceae bacterium]|nr:hypothetical protein [Nannocystaceae bacterium]
MLRPWPLTALLLALACDNSARNEQIANVDKKADPVLDERAEELKRKRQADAEAKAALDDRLHEAIVKLAVAPPPPKKPLGLAEACQAAADAKDRFMQRLAKGEALSKWTAARESDLPMQIIECTSGDSVSAAACQVAALDGAGPELAERMDEIVAVCMAKYAKARPGGAQAASSALPQRPH